MIMSIMKPRVVGSSAIMGITLSVAFYSAAATEKYATQTGVPCAKCHEYPTGDARPTPLGKAFVTNGHKLPAEGSKPPTKAAQPPVSDTPPK